ncbi:MAG: hypothetical protein HOC91_17780 [Nitrospinaceae bacterium]|jgi:hypothetical protein|nr:hypothetical protein [Nitrospinaceae bacterium]MBT3434426.1 hypothetical protein [Nitrospinaceae bacterium]MBT3820914.1 hypothetical protein [Nitrospinaceae bacterium]MBT4094715.1 hypothetical protein [Nitrospinaceae bacterium]MBT4432363.1 hypothetical protein [Nitrospinaceae bacterium]
MAELRVLGIKALPVSVRGEDVVVGYNVADLCETFGIDPKAGGPMHPEKMMEVYRLVFDALKRAVNQLSLEQLDWISPGRPRSMRQLLWHSFERPILGMEAWEGGAYTEDMVRRYETLSQNYHTQADICAYGDQIEPELAAFLGNSDRLSKKVESYMGPITVHELIELALGHAIQHLRQAYHYMPMMGIEPDSPLAPERYKEVPVPEDLF